ncbi:hypothetical protein [Campylobacter cuniculorum]|uniref:Uncharacterized protein n=2 Tax=Campylobacter cuniculorum TaxID=374106 RepID=A0A1W6BZ72_9BACT|nr:hypothetical protein [Campylobacter cuniculorum]ARJ57386.1 hypothetical protein CCUN_1820 [Campylobacter cuniculorum DSM 23162 = LMG 24588]QOR04822.1 hypothetical protein A0071_02440 [Campylobacter cuniculorum]
MTNKKLSAFKISIHHSLKAKEKNGHLCISEKEESSIIKNISFKKGNNDDVLIIHQDANCPAIQNLFEKKAKLESCDFIVLICKNQNLHIFFCEMKSSISEKNCKKALEQINSSKIFLEYLYKNYRQYFDESFEISLDYAKYFCIYPASNPQKTLTFASSQNVLKFKTIKMDLKGNALVNDIYKFFSI